MPFPVKAWLDAPSTATPITAAALIDMENRLSGNVVRVPLPTGVAATDRAVIQAVLTSAIPGDTVQLAAGSTYSLTSAGTKTFTSAGGTLAYCLEIPSGVTLDLNGSTLKLSAGVDAVVVCNKQTALTTDTNVGLTGFGTIDGTDVLLTGKGCVQFEGVTGLTLDYRMYQTGHAGMFLFNCTNVYAPRIHSDFCRGIGVYLGSPTYPVYDSHFGTIISRNVTADPNNTVTFPGNSVYGNLERSVITTIITSACTGGVKMDRCVDTRIGTVLAGPGGDSSGNSGFKFQSGVAGWPIRTSVSAIHMKSQQAVGLFFESNCVDCTVDSYVGEGNDILGTYADVWVAGTRCTVGQLRSTEAGGLGLYLPSTAADYRFGNVRIRNNGNTAGAATKYGASVSGDGVINDFYAIDDQGTATMVRGMDVAAAAVVHVGRAEVWGQTGVAITCASNSATFGGVRYHATDPMHGEILLTGAATSTAITNGNIQVHGTGPAAEPVVQITPITASAASLAIRASFTANTLTLRHAAAAGTERYRWQIVGWVRTTTAAA